MTDFNQLFEELADAIADKVVARLASQQGTDWPAVETKVVPAKPEVIHPLTPLVTTTNTTNPLVISDKTPFTRTIDKINADKVVEEVEEEKVVETLPTGEGVALADSKAPGDRIDELTKVNIRTLRRKAAAVGVDNDSHNIDHYEKYEKPELVILIVNFEMLVGKTVDELAGNTPAKAEKVDSEPEEVPDDTDYSTPEPEDDDDSPPLTREGARALDLATLKTIAIDEDIEASKLTGLDVEEVVKLLFGEEPVEAAPVAEPEVTESEEDEEEEGGWTEDEIRGASRAELQGMIVELNKQLDDDSQIEYSRSTTDEDLAQTIIDLVI